MIVAHFFLRRVRKKPVLFVETTSSQGIEQPSPAAQPLCEVSESGRRQDWLRKAYYAFSKKFPGLELVDAMENTIRLESDHPSFDLVFRPKSRTRSAVDRITEESAGSRETSGADERHGTSVPVLSVLKNMFL